MKRQGYTLVEVSLVIAITALLFIGFLASVSGTLASRRYNDSVQGFADFLRRQYSQVINVQSAGFGNTSEAIYGRIITFGEDGKTIYSYDVIGKALEADAISSANVFSDQLGGNVIAKQLSTNKCYAINQESFDISNGAWVEPINATAGSDDSLFRGTIFIIRSPIDGSVTTRFTSAITNVQSYLTGATCSISSLQKELADNYIDANRPANRNKPINLCVASDDQPQDQDRRNIRIAAGGSSTSAVQIIAQDSEDNQCRR